MVWIVKKFRNLLGTFQGYSGCLKCKDSWNWKKSHDLKYSKDEAMFPLCEECWSKIDIKEKKHYVDKLLMKWRIDGTPLKELEKIKRKAYQAINCNEEAIPPNTFEMIGTDSKLPL